MQKIFRLMTVLLIGLGAASFALADALWIDVRSTAEYAEDHIDGDLNIPHDQIAAQIAKHVTDKNAEIRLYCRSGNRAGIALKELQALGYTNISNEGSIGDARRERKLCTFC